MTSLFIKLLTFCLLFLILLLPRVDAQALVQKTDEKHPILQSAPELAYYVIGYIVIEGNRKTRKDIILRELDLKVGDTLFVSKIDTALVRNRNKIFNTNLFVTVDLSLENANPPQALLRIKLEERWYIFPGPIFELSDRNFNEWWNTYDADFGRTNYGVRVVIENFRGRKEKLDLLAQFGFTRKFGLVYEIPYIDQKQKHGLIFGASYRQNKSIAYRTSGHQLDFADSSSVLQERLEASVALTKRNAYYQFHRLELKYVSNYVADTILELNPQFYLSLDNRIQYFNLSYSFKKDKRDIAAYPLHGNLLQLEAHRSGLGIFNGLNNTRFLATYQLLKELGKGFYLENFFKGRVSFQPEQPYFNAQALGYREDFLRGYELYVIDGHSYVLSKNTLRFQLFKTQKELNFIPIQQFRTIPLAAYLTAYFDTGYVRDDYFTENNQRFSNKLLYGAGLGLDVVTFYDLIFKLNYSVNRDGEFGFFLNFRSSL